MASDFSMPAIVIWHSDEEEPPEDWSGGIAFASLRDALESIVGGTPQTGHPWVRCGERLLSPQAIEDMWRRDGIG